MDDPFLWIGIIVFGIIVVWQLFRRWSGEYDDGGTEYDEGYSDYDDSDRSWSSSVRRSSVGGSSFHSSSRSSPGSSGSSSVSKSRPTKTYDSPKVQSRGGFGRSKK
jgi:hypothetical protein